MSNWHESWDKMEESVRRERDIGEKPEPCGECGGQSFEEGEWPDGYKDCPRCLGTGVQP